MSKQKEDIKLIERYKDKTGEELVDMKKVAEWAIEKGYRKEPIPQSPIDMLATKLSSAARQETRRDNETGEHYRAYHVVPQHIQGKQLSMWVDIDKASKDFMQKSLQKRREQIVYDATQLAIDKDRWNRNNKTEEPIQIEFDFTLDVEWARSVPYEQVS